MTFIATIKVLGTLHGILALFCLWFAFKMLYLLENEYLSRARAVYTGCTSLLQSSLLLLCAVFAWQRPAVAWFFALLALLTFLLSPRLGPRKINTFRAATPFLKQWRRYRPFGMATRILGVILLAGAAYGLSG